MSIKPLFMPTILTLVACESIDDVTPLETDPAVASDADAPAASLESVEVEIAVDASALLRARDGREVAAPRVAVFADDGAEALPDDLAAASCDSCEQGPDSWSCFGCSPGETHGAGPAETSPATELVQPQVVEGACPASKGDYFFLEAALGPQSFAIDTSGQLWAWGANDSGQLGIGTVTVSETKPKKVSGGHQFQSVSGGNQHTIALDFHGNVWAWGTNVYWQSAILDGTGYSSVPKKVPGVSGVVQIAAGGDFSLALTDQGKIWAWGRNDKGQLAKGHLSSRSAPAIISGLGTANQIGAGDRFAAARTGTTLWVWGANDRGQLGINGAVNLNQTLPVAVNLPAVRAFGVGPNFVMTHNIGESMYAWGENSLGTLADGTLIQRKTPVKIARPPVWDVTSIKASTSSVFVTGVSQFGAPPGLELVYSAGQNSLKELFLDSPGPVKTLKKVTSLPDGYNNWLRLLEAGNQYTLVRIGDAVKAIGENGLGQLGDGTKVDRIALTNVCLP